MRIATARLSLLGVLAADAAALAALHLAGRQPWLAVDWDQLAMWLSHTPPEDAVAAVLRVAGLVCGYWLLVSTLAYLLARASGRGLLAAAIGRVTAPAVRSLTDRSLALVLATGALALPAFPAGADEVPVRDPVVVRDGDHVLPPGVQPPRAAPPVASRPEPATPNTRDTEAAAPATHRVEPGDNLWSVAASRVRAATHGAVEDGEIARYWVAVIAANRDGLASKDPDLIYPGEEIVLPPLRQQR